MASVDVLESLGLVLHPCHSRFETLHRSLFVLGLVGILPRWQYAEVLVVRIELLPIEFHGIPYFGLLFVLRLVDILPQ